MTPFNPDHKDTLTFGEMLRPAMEITEQADADQYFKEAVLYIQKKLDKEPRNDSKTAEDIVKENLGYFAGYYDTETRERVERLFQCAHPVFGSVSQNGVPTNEEAFLLGILRAQRNLRSL